MIEGYLPSGTETGLAALALQGLDIPPLPPFTVPHQRVHCLVRNPMVATLRVWTGVPLRWDVLLPSPAALALSPGLHIPLEALYLHLQP